MSRVGVQSIQEHFGSRLSNLVLSFLDNAIGMQIDPGVSPLLGSLWYLCL